jgi:hypothetical protein
MIGSSDSDSDDDKRVVRSAKDRRFDELRLTSEEIRVCPSLQTQTGMPSSVTYNSGKLALTLELWPSGSTH